MKTTEDTRSGKMDFKTSLLSLGLGLTVMVGTLAFLAQISNDMRWVLLLGSAGLFGSAIWVSKRRGGLVSVLLLCLPLITVFGVLALGELPGLWPHLVFWFLFPLIGWYAFRPARRHALPALLAALVVSSAAYWYCAAYLPAELARTLNQFSDHPAPEFALRNLDGTPYPMDSLEGKIVVLDFFATWCLPCIAELPELDSVREDLSDREDIEILVVANDSGGDTPDSIRAFAEKRQLGLPFVYDPDGKAHAAFGYPGLPGLVVMDRSRRIRLTRDGYNAADTHFREDLISFIEGL